MIIEIRKAGFTNKGAELMLWAIVEKLRERYPESILTMAPTHLAASQPFRRVVDAGMYPKAWLWKYGLQWGHLACLAPQKLREMYGIVLDRDVDVVIDASGFSYSDQWGEASTRELAASAARWRRRGTTIVLMPQAFGPFTSNGIQKAIRRAASHIDLLMPRDDRSYEYLTAVAGQLPSVRQYPDFTNLVEGVKPDGIDWSEHRVCIVPNYRMIDKAGDERGRLYAPFMIRCVKELVNKDAKPFLLVHDSSKDVSLANEISEAVGGIPILSEDDPLKIKGIIGASRALIGSRFHGLVSALSQGVPSLATGWSHKYAELFREYGVPEGILDINDSEYEVSKKIDWVVSDMGNREFSRIISPKADILRKASTEMWDEVFEKIEKKTE